WNGNALILDGTGGGGPVAGAPFGGSRPLRPRGRGAGFLSGRQASAGCRTKPGAQLWSGKVACRIAEAGQRELSTHRRELRLRDQNGGDEHRGIALAGRVCLSLAAAASGRKAGQCPGGHRTLRELRTLRAVWTICAQLSMCYHLPRPEATLA